MIEEIEEALESHPYDQVAEMLKGWGLTIAAGSLKQYVNAYRRENGTATPTSSSRRSRTKGKAGKQKSKQTAAVGSKPEAEKQEFEEKTAVQKKATGRKPDAFLNMPEDL